METWLLYLFLVVVYLIGYAQGRRLGRVEDQARRLQELENQELPLYCEDCLEEELPPDAWAPQKGPFWHN